MSELTVKTKGEITDNKYDYKLTFELNGVTATVDVQTAYETDEQKEDFEKAGYRLDNFAFMALDATALIISTTRWGQSHALFPITMIDDFLTGAAQAMNQVQQHIPENVRAFLMQSLSQIHTVVSDRRKMADVYTNLMQSQNYGDEPKDKKTPENGGRS